MEQPDFKLKRLNVCNNIYNEIGEFIKENYPPELLYEAVNDLLNCEDMHKMYEVALLWDEKLKLCDKK